MGRHAHLRAGSLHGDVYLFDAGDKLVKHTHVPETEHITIILSGMLRITSGSTITDWGAGEIIDFPPGIEHELEAIVPDTKFINMVRQRKK
jgi:quercetin dioxygenase-like cupin family protein